MPMVTDVCSSCGVRLTAGHNVTSFHCPGCSGTTMGRCGQCRDQGVAYVCDGCGFSGP